jgi:uncharacterized protein YdhG (YjbR/CyaY superfamily)
MPAKTKPATVDEYLAAYPPDVQEILSRLRAVVRETAPQAVEKISYNMPAYHMDGFLVSFSAWKRHIGIYPCTQAVLANIPELADYKGTKGSLHFPLDQPLPYDLIARLVQVRVAENLAQTPKIAS